MNKRYNTRPPRPWWKRVGKKVIRNLRHLLVLVGLMIWPIIRLFVSPRVVFVVYGTDADQRAYWPRWMHPFIPRILPIGVLRLHGSAIGLVVASKWTLENFEADPSLAIRLTEQVRRALPRARAVALAGRLPSWIIQAGGNIQQPFVQGDVGTCHAMLSSLLAGAKEIGRDPKELTLGLLGGAGFIGSRLTEISSYHFGKVIALDPRYIARKNGGNVIMTSDVSEVATADIVMVLTAKGDDIANAVPWVRTNTLVLDDTHPPISGELRNQIRHRGAKLRKVVVGTRSFGMRPRLPNFRAWNIPGCLLEAMVVGFRGWSTLHDSDIFLGAAASFNFEARLIEHPED